MVRCCAWLAASLVLAACAGPSATAPICTDYTEQRSRVPVTTTGQVVRVLGIRRGPSGVHEGFLVALAPEQGCRLTIRVEHNVDLGGRIPLTRGERVELRGEYIYDRRGGIVHFTHHDPRGRHAGGYVRANGELYQ